MYYKKSQGLPLNTIVIAILVIIVMLVIVVFFTSNISESSSTISDTRNSQLSCENAGGICSSSCEIGDRLSVYRCSGEQTPYCCKKNSVSNSGAILHEINVIGVEE